jgi:hypothetical protein
LASGTARAATITQGVVNAVVPTPQGVGFQMDKFDPAKGTLNGVTFTRTNQFELQNREVVHTGAGSVTFDLGAQFLYGLPGIAITDLEKLTDVFVYADCPAGAAGQCSTPYNPGQVYSQTRILAVAPAQFGDFIGTGTFNGTYQTFAYELQTGFDPNFVSLRRETLAGGNFSLVYDYEPAPEPTSLALFGLAGAALTVARRRRRS